jgi:hypothetical protein
MAFPDRLQEGLKFKNAHNLFIMWAPNILNPYKLTANVRHPVGEVIHTSHQQYRAAMIDEKEYDVVEHRFGKRLVTVDVIVLDSYRKGFLPRAKQIFDRRFYLGHEKDFPQPFTLVNRTFVKPGSGFNKEAHIREVINSVQRRYEGPVQVFPFRAFAQVFLSIFSFSHPAFATNY